MKAHEFEGVAAELMHEAERIAAEKRPAYTQGAEDVLANFKTVATRTGSTPGQVVTVYLLKHIDAVTTALCRPDLPQAESVLSRFADAVNYLKLGYALVAERDTPATPPTPSDPVPHCDGWS